MRLKRNAKLFFLTLFTGIFFIWAEMHKNMKNIFPLNWPKEEELSMPTKSFEALDFAETCMQRNDSKFAQYAIPGAPIESMPPYNQLLHWTSARETVCGDSEKATTVWVILNRMKASDIRGAIRETFGNLTAATSSNNPILSHWRKLFLVGAPENELDAKMLAKENEIFGDVVVTNIVEHYKNLTLKLLIGLKFTSCYCPYAKYYVKSDDDIYVEVEKLDGEIKKQQELLNGLILQGKKPKNSVLYMGFSNSRNVNKGKNGKWAVDGDLYKLDKFPPHMKGGLVVIAMSAVREMAFDCPYHCIGLDPTEYKKNLAHRCFWFFEDVFLGSCLNFTQKDTHLRSFAAMGKWVSLKAFIEQDKKGQLKDTYVHGIPAATFKLIYEYITKKNSVS